MSDLKIRIEKRRGFQPPWYTVAVYSCPCGATRTVRRSWKGGAPPGAIKCDCGALLPLA
jgi:hypothetical protein